jgi:putative transposase/transposase-like zinc-binding protein
MTTVVQQRPVLEVADVLRTHGASYLDAQGPHLSRDQLRAVKELALCRTAALGGHTEHCGGCGTPRISYNSCRNRHCPKCQASTRADWLEREAQTLLPVDYYHVVFTLPAALGPLALQNARVLYDLLLRTAWETVRELASDPRYLGATVGLLAVLHTWGQTLCHHPHVHCVVTGGGLACDVNGRGEEPPRWRACRPGFFLPVRVLSRLFRGKFLAGLQAAYDGGQVGCHGRLAALAAPAAFAAWLTPLYRAEWVVYAKPPFGGPEQVLKYLARYTHRVAISNSRLVDMDADQVTFRYKDYADDRRHKTMALTAHEFIRRFLQHVLPSGFMKIRHYGLLANRYREANLRVCRALLLIVTLAARLLAAGADRPSQPSPCPHCGGHDWRLVGHTPRPRVSEVCRLPLPQVAPPDSS